MLKQLVVHRIGQLLLISGPLISLIISPSANYDPISLVKMVTLSTLAFSILFMSLQVVTFETIRQFKIIYSLVSLFIFFSISTFLFSGAPLDQQFWGQFGRNTGILTYFCFMIVLLSSATLSLPDFGAKLMRSILLAATPMTVYCLIQITGNDPISWSSFDTFGTLGNINFLSAFFGLSTLTAFSMILMKESSSGWKALALALIFLDIPIIWSTGSIQGLMMIVAGASVLILLKIAVMRKATIKLTGFSILLLIGFIATLNGLRNKGPLASFLYQPSVTFREDYMHAGWEMTLMKPFVGVGIDSYGDWYRQTRGEISTLRTGPDRTANTAHNIFLDVSSGGGFPLGIIFVLIFLYCAFQSLKFAVSLEKFDSIFAGLFSTWIGYVVQALVSINQIGVGIWGFLFTGALLAYVKIQQREESSGQVRKKNTIKMKGQLLPPKVALIGILGATIGFAAAFLPFRADQQFKLAGTRPLESQIVAAESLGAPVFYRELTLERALREQSARARDIALEIVSRNPRSYFAWLAISSSPSSSYSEVSEAKQRLKQLDPFNPQN